MTKKYIYCVIDSESKVKYPIRGMRDEFVYSISYNGISTVVSDIKEELLPYTAPLEKGASKNEVLCHEKVVEKMMDTFTVLPFRFHTIVQSTDSLILMMNEYYEDFKENLRRFQHKAEFGVRAIWDGDAAKEGVQRKVALLKSDSPKISGSDASPGRKFINEKLEKYKVNKEFREKADKRITVLDNFFCNFAAEKKLEKLKSDNLLLNASYLVEKCRQEQFKRSFTRLKEAQQDLKLLFSGPWPPYNFIKLSKKSWIR